MQQNVLGYEPHLALFVPGSDALLFYRAMALKAKSAFRSNGILYAEINEQYGRDLKMLFTETGYSQVEIIRDINGKDRMLRARL